MLQRYGMGGWVRKIRLQNRLTRKMHSNMVKIDHAFLLLLLFPLLLLLLFLPLLIFLVPRFFFLLLSFCFFLLKIQLSLLIPHGTFWCLNSDWTSDWHPNRRCRKCSAGNPSSGYRNTTKSSWDRRHLKNEIHVRVSTFYLTKWVNRVYSYTKVSPIVLSHKDSPERRISWEEPLLLAQILIIFRF